MRPEIASNLWWEFVNSEANKNLCTYLCLRSDNKSGIKFLDAWLNGLKKSLLLNHEKNMIHSREELDKLKHLSDGVLEMERQR
jgi:hypothetical protein